MVDWVAGGWQPPPWPFAVEPQYPAPRHLAPRPGACLVVFFFLEPARCREAEARFGDPKPIILTHSELASSPCHHGMVHKPLQEWNKRTMPPKS